MIPLYNTWLVPLLIFFCLIGSHLYAKKDESSVHVIYVTILPNQTTIPFFFETKENIDKINILLNNYKIGQVVINNKMAAVQLRFNTEGTKTLQFMIYSTNRFIYSFSGTITISKKQTASSLLMYPPASGSREEETPSASKEEPDNPNKNKKESLITNNSFVDDVIPIVASYSEQYKLPTSAIVAMAILESGYGTSELALKANNFFGLKDWCTNHSDSYLYDKQEEGNWYKKFSSKESCIEFFIKEVLLHQTGKWKKNYTSVIKTYQQDLDNDISKERAAIHFIEQLIENGYSTLSIEEYSRRILKIINQYNLYLLDY